MFAQNGETGLFEANNIVGIGERRYVQHRNLAQGLLAEIWRLDYSTQMEEENFWGRLSRSGYGFLSGSAH